MKIPNNFAFLTGEEQTKKTVAAAKTKTTAMGIVAAAAAKTKTKQSSTAAKVPKITIRRLKKLQKFSSRNKLNYF